MPKQRPHSFRHRELLLPAQALALVATAYVACGAPSSSSVRAMKKAPNAGLCCLLLLLLLLLLLYKRVSLASGAVSLAVVTGGCDNVPFSAVLDEPSYRLVPCHCTNKTK